MPSLLLEYTNNDATKRIILAGDFEKSMLIICANTHVFVLPLLNSHHFILVAQKEFVGSKLSTTRGWMGNFNKFPRKSKCLGNWWRTGFVRRCTIEVYDDQLAYFTPIIGVSKSMLEISYFFGILMKLVNKGRVNVVVYEKSYIYNAKW